MLKGKKSKKFLATAGLTMTMLLGTPSIPAMAMDTAAVTASEVSALQAREQFEQALGNLKSLEQGLANFEVKVSTPVMNGGCDGDFTFVSAPFLQVKGNMGVEMGFPGVPSQKATNEFYVNESEDSFTYYYQKPDNTWGKSVTSKDQWKQQLNMGGDMGNISLPEPMELVKSVQLGEKDGTNQSYLVTVDGAKLSSVLNTLLSDEKVAAAMQKNLASSGITSEMIKDVVANMGDTAFTVTIDEKQQVMTGFHADLTAPVRNMALAAMKHSKMSKKDRKDRTEFINNSTLEINFRGQKLDKVPDLTVPSDVSSTAKVENSPWVATQQS